MKRVDAFRLEKSQIDLLEHAPGTRGDTVRLLIELGLNGNGAESVVADFLREKSGSSEKGFVLRRAAEILEKESDLDGCQEALNL